MAPAGEYCHETRHIGKLAPQRPCRSKQLQPAGRNKLSSGTCLSLTTHVGANCATPTASSPIFRGCCAGSRATLAPWARMNRGSRFGVRWPNPAWVEICRQRTHVSVPDFISAAYFASLSQLPPLIAAAASRDWDDDYLACAMAAFAAVKGNGIVGEAALELNTQTAEVLGICQRGVTWQPLSARFSDNASKTAFQESMGALHQRSSERWGNVSWAGEGE